MMWSMMGLAVRNGLAGASGGIVAQLKEFPVADRAKGRRRELALASDLREAKAALHRKDGLADGRAVFKGTRIPATLIAAMLDQGTSETDILDGYPALTSRMIELAKIWVAAHPGRELRRDAANDGYVLKSTKRILLKNDPHPRRADPIS